MAEIKSGDISRFLKNPPGSYLAFLICGSDSGLVAERTKLIVDTLAGNENDPFRLVRLDGDTLAQDVNRLADEALTIGLFGGDRIIWITAGSKNFLPSLEALVLLRPRGCRLVIEAGSLKNDSALRRFCIKSSNVAVLECWPDGVREIAGMIEDEMSSSGLSITPEALDLLTSLLGADRLLSRSEVDKVKAYAHGQTSVSERDVSAIVADASRFNFDQVIIVAFDGDYACILETVKQVVVDFDPGTLLGVALGHALMLHQLRLEIEGGRSIEEAADRGPRLFGKKKTSILHQLRIWNSDALLHQANRLSESILHMRRESRLGEEIAVRTLLGVAYAAAPRRDFN